MASRPALPERACLVVRAARLRCEPRLRPRLLWQRPAPVEAAENRRLQRHFCGTPQRPGLREGPPSPRYALPNISYVTLP